MSSRKLAAEAEALAQKRENRWMWGIGAVCITLAIVTIVVIVIALEPSNNDIPESIDVVLYQSTEPVRSTRYIPQSKAVRKFLTWARNVYVLSSLANPGWDPVLNVEIVPFSGSALQGFEYMPNIPGISTHAIFLSDMTFPFRDVPKSYLFYQSRPRMFNIFRDQAEVYFLSKYLELPTMPVLVTDLEKFSETTRVLNKSSTNTWQDLVFREITEERVMLREDMNRDVFVVSTLPDNAKIQFEKLKANPSLFATFHVNSQDPDKVSSNNVLLTFLSTHFS